MNIYEIISKKKHGKELSEKELAYFARGYLSDDIADYQASALLMAICINGMTDKETVSLTKLIAQSGDALDLSALGAFTADKHSTGGVGDKTTLISCPIAASAGCKIAKMSGRGLGHTGGTVDKLEAIPGFSTSLSEEDFIGQVEKIGIAVVGQSKNLAPLDKKLYALRDVTATVDSIPLIASSVMGKKLASGAKSIVLDVKYGSGSFMKTPKEATLLAEKMVAIGKNCGRTTSALITNMDIPLGRAIGNALEVKEAIALLSGANIPDLKEICLSISAEIISNSLGKTADEAMHIAQESLTCGRALNKFREWMIAQGADLSYIDSPEKFGQSKIRAEVLAPKDGYITHMNTEKIGLCALELGAGRKILGQAIDPTAGIFLAKKTSERVSAGQPIAILYTDKADVVADVTAELLKATEIEDTPLYEPELIARIIR